MASRDSIRVPSDAQRRARILAGEKNRDRFVKQIAGQRFGRLLAVSYRRKNCSGRYRIYWKCKCDCGNEAEIEAFALSSGATQSCGCIFTESLRTRSKTHGKSRTREYRIWAGIIYRCENPNSPVYDRYGGRGIRICRRWRNSFEAFLSDVGEAPSPKHSLDRIRNERGYSPANCRWATALEQSKNTSRNIPITCFGKTMCLSDWSRETGINPGTIKSRIFTLGWDAEKALTKASATRKKPHPNVATTWPEYVIWRGIIARCESLSHPKFNRYGGRGIGICDRWRHSFRNFLSDVGFRPSDAHSLHRIDNDKGYEPDNCKWATAREQSRGTSQTRIVTLDGRSLCLTDWAMETGVPCRTIAARIDLYGWSDKEAVFTPVRGKRIQCLDSHTSKLSVSQVEST